MLQFLFLIFLSLLTPFVWAQGGADISGGGNVLRYQGVGEPFLLDLVAVNPDFVERNGFSEPGQELLFEKSLNPNDIIQGSAISWEKQAPKTWALLQTRLGLWSENSPRTVQLLRELIAKINWRGTLFVLGLRSKRNYHMPDEVKKRKPGVIYPVGSVIAGYGVYINQWFWNSFVLGYTSRAGLIAHEALRTYQLEINSQLTEKVLQEVTGHLMISDPKHFSQGFLDRKMREVLGTDDWSQAEFRRQYQFGEYSDMRMLSHFSTGPFFEDMTWDERNYVDEVRSAALDKFHCLHTGGKQKLSYLFPASSSDPIFQELKNAGKCVSLRSKHFTKGLPSLPRYDH